MDVEALNPGTVIDRYVVESFVGQGGMATVVKVRHQQLGTAHALKVLSVASSTIRSRLLMEGRLQASLQHENVVKVTDLVTLTSGAPGLIMEFVEGPNLDELLIESPPTLAQADHLAQGILRGVEEAHRHGLVHRDLKPANILLQPSHDTWIPKVADFGIAKVLAGDGNHSGHTRTGVTMGTPNYMAPEQARDSKNIGTTADIFALGAILYELLTKERAFEGEDLLDTLNQVAEARYTPILERRPGTPPGMVAAIEAALQVDVADRPQTVDELRRLWLGGRPPLSSPVPFDNVRPREHAAPPISHRSTTSQTTMNPAESDPEADPAASIVRSGAPGTPLPRRARIGIVVVAGILVGGLMAAAAATAAIVALQLNRDEAVDAPTAVAPATQATVEPPTTAPRIPSPAVQATLEPVPEPEPAEPEPTEPIVAEPEGSEPVPEPIPEPEAPPSVVAAEPPGEEPLTMATEPVPQAVVSPVPLPALPEPDAPEPVAPDPLEEVVDAIAAIGATEPEAPREPEPEPTVELQGYLANGDPSVRKRGIKNAAYRTDAQSRHELGVVMRDDPDPSVRRAAWMAIVALMTDDDPHVAILQDHAGWQLAEGEENFALQAAKVLRGRGSRPGLLIGGLRRRSLDIQLATLDAVEALPPDDRRTLRSEVERLLVGGHDKLERRAADVLSLMD